MSQKRSLANAMLLPNLALHDHKSASTAFSHIRAHTVTTTRGEITMNLADKGDQLQNESWQSSPEGIGLPEAP
jgi:hypothetical protein